MKTPESLAGRVPTPPEGAHLTPRLLAAIAPLAEPQREIVVAAVQARRRAESANRAKLQWLRVMSHELRTPLNAIGGFVQLLKSGVRGQVPASMRGDLDRIERNQRHMASLIEDVLQFARLDAGRVHFDVVRVPVRRLLLHLHDFVPPAERARGRRVVVHRCAAQLTALADEDKTRQILLNLVANALRHTPDDAMIEVMVVHPTSGAAPDGTVVIAVKDNGPGIPADRIDRLFEPFFQAGRALNRPVEGLGLGLTIARELARGMGGDLTAISPPGEGAKFLLALRSGS